MQQTRSLIKKMHISFRNLMNKTLVFLSINLVGCAGDDSFSSHVSLSDRLREKKVTHVVFVDFQPTRISVFEQLRCKSSLENCVVSSVLEKSILFATDTGKMISDQKTSQEKILSQKIKNAYDRSELVDLFFITLASETTKCGIQLNTYSPITIKNEKVGSISGMTSLNWKLSAGESTQHLRGVILPKLSSASNENSMMLLVVISQIGLALGENNMIFPEFSYKFYDNKIDAVTSMGGALFATKNKEIRVVRDIDSESEIEKELKISAHWASKRLAYDMCGGISSDNPHVKFLGNELR
jgi:hypothetical protein